jgi:hypothetical protein
MKALFRNVSSGGNRMTLKTFPRGGGILEAPLLWFRCVTSQHAWGCRDRVWGGMAVASHAAT